MIPIFNQGASPFDDLYLVVILPSKPSSFYLSWAEGRYSPRRSPTGVVTIGKAVVSALEANFAFSAGDHLPR